MKKVEGFFYGLYMDAAVLEKSGIVGEDRRLARVDDFKLRIGDRATLLESPGDVAYGVLQRLSFDELDTLYASLEQYRPQAVLAKTFDQKSVPALCYNLTRAPDPAEKNEQYATALKQALTELGFPAEYIDSIE